MNGLTFQPADDFHTGSRKDILLVRRVGQFGGQVLPGEVEIFVKVQPPLGAIGHIVHDAVVRDKFSGAALSILPAQFEVRNDAVLIIHAVDYTGYPKGIIHAVNSKFLCNPRLITGKIFPRN